MSSSLLLIYCEYFFEIQTIFETLNTALLLKIKVITFLQQFSFIYKKWKIFTFQIMILSVKKWRDDLFSWSHLHKLERTTRSMFLNLKSLNEWRDRMLDFVYAERTSLSLRQKSMSTWWKCRHICYYEDPWTYLISSKAFRAFFSSSFMVSRSLTRAYMRGCLRTRKMMSSTWERKKWDF